VNRLRYIIIGIGLLFAVVAMAAKKNFTLVIDAGHGGRDAGAIGQAKVKEKDLTLRYALAFGRMVEQNCPDVKVIYTRKTDTFVELYRRAEIANKNKADLFISIHINSLPRGKRAYGFQTYTLGKSKRTGKKTGVLENLEVAKRENAVILLEKDYKQTYQGYDPNSPESNIMFEFIQDKNMENSVELAKYMQKYVCQATGRQDMGAQQDNLAVLRLSSMPGCLVECGFISTRDEESFMNSKSAAEKYARGLFNAFKAYRQHHGGSQVIAYQQESKPEVQPEEKPEVVPDMNLEVVPVPVAEVREEPEAPEVPETMPEPVAKPVSNMKPAAPAVSAPVFKVQILTSSDKLSPRDARFKGQKNTSYYKDGKVYKYTVGESTDYNAILRLRREVAASFPQAFVIAFRDGVRMDINEAIREFKSRKKR
jgi:N-acetylmuramoyl-L-alanine amidase